MLSYSTPVVASSIPLYHNAIKSLIFRFAGLLLASAVYKTFSLIAAGGNLFTSYLMFNESYIQRGWFIYSRGLFSFNGFLISAFTLMYILAEFYGTILWAVDSPGYLMQGKNASLSSFDNAFPADPTYVVSIAATPSKLGLLEENLPLEFGAGLFNPSRNLTLTETVLRGTPQTTRPTQSGTGGRIWLDDEGLSVSPDTAVMVSYNTDETGRGIPIDCPVQIAGTGWAWNCTFNNTFSQRLATNYVGLPEVHWDDASDKELDSRYIQPNRRDNIWASYGEGGGTVAMKQVFTVTKGSRRHTFLETVLRFTMVTNATYDFAISEVDDLLRRTWSLNESEQHHPLLGRLSYSINRAQTLKKSFSYGGNGVAGTGNTTTAQTTWEYLTWETTDGSPYISMFRISVTNITLIRSETIDPPSRAPSPFNNTTCSASFMNLAYGGQVTDTDCVAGGLLPAGAGLNPNSSATPHFFGQVDTAAVVILLGLGDGRNNLSANALDQTVWEWLLSGNIQQRMDALLLARAFSVSVDPALVTVTATVPVPAASWLQITLVLLAVIAAALTWVLLTCFTQQHWRSSLLWNLVDSTTEENRIVDGESRKRRARKGVLGKIGSGNLKDSPEISLTALPEGSTMTINKRLVTLANAPSVQS